MEKLIEFAKELGKLEIECGAFLDVDSENGRVVAAFTLGTSPAEDEFDEQQAAEWEVFANKLEEKGEGFELSCMQDAKDASAIVEVEVKEEGLDLQKVGGAVQEFINKLWDKYCEIREKKNESVSPIKSLLNQFNEWEEDEEGEEEDFELNVRFTFEGTVSVRARSLEEAIERYDAQALGANLHNLNTTNDNIVDWDVELGTTGEIYAEE